MKKHLNRLLLGALHPTVLSVLVPILVLCIAVGKMCMRRRSTHLGMIWAMVIALAIASLLSAGVLPNLIKRLRLLPQDSSPSSPKKTDRLVSQESELWVKLALFCVLWLVPLGSVLCGVWWPCIFAMASIPCLYSLQRGRSSKT